MRLLSCVDVLAVATACLLWLLAGVATGGLCFGAGIAVEQRRLLTRRPRPASSTGTAALLDLPEHNKP